MKEKRIMGIWEQRMFMFLTLAFVCYVGHTVESDWRMLTAGLFSIAGATISFFGKLFFERRGAKSNA